MINNKTKKLRKDLIGKKFNELTVLKFLRIENGHGLWKFRCSCGKIIETLGKKVFGGGKKSCGCLFQKQNIKTAIGKIINGNKVLEFSGKKKKDKGGHNRNVYICSCGLCSNKFEATLNGLKNRTSCGCKRKATETSTQHILYLQIKNGAKIRNLTFDMTFNEYLMLSKENCLYCNKPPEFKNSKALAMSINANGIDRIDNTKGYIKGNLAPCCAKCNTMKLDDTQEEFFKQIELIYHNIKKYEKKKI